MENIKDNIVQSLIDSLAYILNDLKNIDLKQRKEVTLIIERVITTVESGKHKLNNLYFDSISLISAIKRFLNQLDEKTPASEVDNFLEYVSTYYSKWHELNYPPLYSENVDKTKETLKKHIDYIMKQISATDDD